MTVIDTFTPGGRMLGRKPKDLTSPRVRLRRKAGATVYYRPQADWGCDAMNTMALNDRLGCCTISAKVHLITSQQFYGQGRTVVVPDAEVLKGYTAVSGYDPKTGRNDVGATMQDSFDYFRKTGFVAGGQTYKIEAFAEVAHDDIDLIKLCIDNFGGVDVGMWFPDYAEKQFDAGQVWDVPRNNRYQNLGGHDVPIIGYGADYFDCWTWQRRQRMTIPFFLKNMDEVWAQGDRDWQRADGTVPSGLDADGAQAQFAQVVGGDGPGWDSPDVPPVVIDPPVEPPVPAEDADRKLAEAFDNFTTDFSMWRASKTL